MLSASAILGRKFDILSASLDGLVARQAVRAENLANVDTPGYHTRTVDFESQLRAALPRPDDGFTGLTPTGTLAMIPAGAQAAGDGAAAIPSEFRTISTGGPVEKATEANGMLQDNIRYRVLVQQVTNSLSSLKGVIAEMGRG